VNDGNSLAQDSWSPHFSRSRPAKKLVPWRVALDTDHVQPGGVILDREVDAERIVLRCHCDRAAKRAKIILHRLAEAIVQSLVAGGGLGRCAGPSRKPRVGPAEVAFGDASRVFHVALQEIPRRGELAPRDERIGNVVDGHRSHHVYFLARARHSNVQATLTAFLSQHAKVASEGTLAVAAECGRKNDDIALVALNVFDIFHKDRHVFALLVALALQSEGFPEADVLLRAALEHCFDQVCLFAVERHHAHARAFGIRLLPDLRQHVYHAFGLFRIGLVLVNAIHPDQFDRLELRELGLGMAHGHAQIAAVERRIGIVDQFAERRAVVDLQAALRHRGTRELQQVRTILDLAPVPGLVHRLSLLIGSIDVQRLTIEILRLVILDLARKKRRRRHLFLVSPDDRDARSIKRRQRVFDRHLRRLVVNDRVEETRLQRQHAAGDVRVH